MVALALQVVTLGLAWTGLIWKCTLEATEVKWDLYL